MGKGEGAVVSACMLEHSHGGAAARFMVRQLATHPHLPNMDIIQRNQAQSRSSPRTSWSANLPHTRLAAARESPAGGSCGER